MASTPSHSNFQKPAGSRTSPGKRQPMPTIAIGSWAGSRGVDRPEAGRATSVAASGSWWSIASYLRALTLNDALARLRRHRETDAINRAAPSRFLAEMVRDMHLTIP